MRALSIQQPWANMIVDGIKVTENRSWESHYRGILLIHASKTIHQSALNARDLLAGQPLYRKMCPPEYLAQCETIGRYNAEPRGAIVGVCVMLGCVGTEKAAEYVARTVGADTWAYKCVEGPYCFVLQHAVRLRVPVPYAGKPGMFDVPRIRLTWEVELKAARLHKPEWGTL